MSNNVCELIAKLKNEDEMIRSLASKLLMSDGDCISVIKRYCDYNDYTASARYFSENGFSVSFVNKGSDFEKMIISFNITK